MLHALKTILSQHYAGPLGRTPEVLLKALEAPKQAGHGHVALPVFAWAKEHRKAPPVLAQEIAAQLSASMPSGLKKVEPLSGFVNFTFETKYIQDLLVAEILGKRGSI